MTEPARLIRPAQREVRSRSFDSAVWTDLPMRADDIVIATYSKCGTTWTQRIVGMMVFGSAEPFSVHEISPWPDFRIPPPGMAAALAASQTHRRFFKSHLPFDALPHYEGVKYIHVARDGRDASMSFFNHKSNFTPEVVARFEEISAGDPKFSGTQYEFVPNDPAQHFHDWIHGIQDGFGDPYASYFHLEKSYWAARHEPNVLLVHFNDLKADREGEMRRIAQFLEIELPEQVWAEIVEAAGFEAMKKNSAELLPQSSRIFKGGGSTFLHKGTNGRWRDVYRAEDIEEYDRRVAREFSPSLAAWCEQGRLGAGDPLELPD